MTNRKDLAKLREGVASWNRWRDENPDFFPDLSQADLTRFHIGGVNLSGVRLIGAHLNWADLGGANLRGADFSDACLTWTSLNNADLSDANLSNANLFRADLRGANLQRACFDHAILSYCKLWNTDRRDWRISKVVCEEILLDEKAITPTRYEPGEFERLYSIEACIELFYPGDISPFEVLTMPAFLQHLTEKHVGSEVLLQSIERTGGGAKLTLQIKGAPSVAIQDVKYEAESMQMSIRSKAESDEVKPQIRQLLESQRALFETVKALMGRDLQPMNLTIINSGTIHNLASGSATLEIRQTFDDSSTLIALFDKLLTRNSELTAQQSSEAEAAKSELKKSNPDKSRLTRFYEFLQKLPAEAVLKGAGKLGERVAEADWLSLLHKFGELIHHLP